MLRRDRLPKFRPICGQSQIEQEQLDDQWRPAEERGVEARDAVGDRVPRESTQRPEQRERSRRARSRTPPGGSCTSDPPAMNVKFSRIHPTSNCASANSNPSTKKMDSHTTVTLRRKGIRALARAIASGLPTARRPSTRKSTTRAAKTVAIAPSREELRPPLATSQAADADGAASASHHAGRQRVYRSAPATRHPTPRAANVTIFEGAMFWSEAKIEDREEDQRQRALREDDPSGEQEEQDARGISKECTGGRVDPTPCVVVVFTTSPQLA